MTKRRNSALKADIVFHYKDFENEDGLRERFKDYFISLPKKDVLFSCLYVRALEESVGIVFENRPSWRYDKGDLICTKGVESGVSRRCRFGELQSKDIAPIRLNDKGQLEFYCGISDVTLTLEISEEKFRIS